MKTKRIKEVFNTSAEVLHLWANQSQFSARQRSSSGGMHGYSGTRCFFEGKSCYSYGRHYELGRLVEINGKTVALINTTGYSNTTSKHISEAKYACNHLPIIEVDHSFDWKKGLLKMQDYLIHSVFDNLSKNSFWSGYKFFDKYDYLSTEYQKFNNLCDTLNIPEYKLNIDQDTIDLIQEHINYRIERQKELDAGKEERRIKRQQAQLKKNEEQIQAWKLGGPSTNAVTSLSFQIIRIVGNEIETSRGAKVPLNEAISLAKRIKNGENVVGQPIGHFHVSYVDDKQITIGCHKFERSIIDQILNNVHLKLVS